MTSLGPADRELLANELTSVRRRGVAHLNQTRGKKRPIRTPRLDQLATAAGFDIPHSRISQLTAYLRKSLAAYAAVDDQAASLILRLYFDETMRAPGPSGPSVLLKKARAEAGLGEEAFRKTQRENLLAFADFLVEAEPAADQPGPKPLDGRVLVYLVAATLVLGAAVVLLVVSLVGR